MDAGAFAQRMGRLATSGVDVQPILEAGRPIIAQGTREVFEGAHTPDGQAWPARKDPGDGHPLLIETGALLDAAAGEGPGHVDRIENGNTLVVGVDKGVDLGGIPGAAVHNWGFPPRNIAQREWAGFSEETQDKLTEQAADMIAAQL